MRKAPKSANIFLLIDILNGFGEPGLSRQQGGSLYVLGGEKVAKPAAAIIRRASGDTIVASQESHPWKQIAFMSAHPGVVELRKERLRKEGVPEADLNEAIEDPLRLAFDKILLKRDSNDVYRSIAFWNDGQWRSVETDGQGYVTKILDAPYAKANEPIPEQEQTLEQTLWSLHGVKQTYSNQFLPELREALPAEFVHASESAMESLTFSMRDANNNILWLVRKGEREDLDSNGIGIRNDGKTLTAADSVFHKIANRLAADDVQEVDIYIGGLATNFCVEISHANVCATLIPYLQRNGIQVRLHFLEDASAGIPIEVPGGAWPDLAASLKRMNAIYPTDSLKTTDIFPQDPGNVAASLKKNPRCQKG